MPTFGFSAYLKMVSLNERPRGTAIRGRVAGGGGGYDFHRSMKRAAGQLLSGASVDDLAASLNAIKRAPEKLSATNALKRLAEWRAGNPGELTAHPAATYSHPSGLFKVTFTPDFGVQLGRHNTAVHIWNTAQPSLNARTVYAALALFPEQFEGAVAPDDLALLSLRAPQLYRLSEAGRYAGLAQSVADNVAEGFRRAFVDLGVDAPTDQPGHPPG